MREKNMGISEKIQGMKGISDGFQKKLQKPPSQKLNEKKKDFRYTI